VLVDEDVAVYVKWDINGKQERTDFALPHNLTRPDASRPQVEIENSLNVTFSATGLQPFKVFIPWSNCLLPKHTTLYVTTANDCV